MADATPYDVIVIGAGPGGYVAAIRAAQLGMKVACVEKEPKLGGTCLRIGCIPSKALLHASERYDSASHHFKDLGIEITGLKLDLKGMMAHKDKVVGANTQGIEFLFKKNKIDWLKGEGKVVGAGKVSVAGTDYAAKNIIIATGSDVISLPGITIDEKQIVSSTGALALEKVPDTMVVIGAGVIGLELGSVWSRLGAKVTVIEYLDRILPGLDLEIAKETQKILKKQGIEFKLSSKVTSAKPGKKGVDLSVEPAAGGAAESLNADIVLMAVGRKPFTEGLGLKEAGVELDERGRVKTDGHFKTNVPGIYAIGDVIIGPMLAHKAEDEGMAVAEIIAGQKPHIDYNLIPGVVYTHPEVASVGKTEEQLKAENVQYKAGKFPYLANGRARAMNATEGFVKILADAKTDKVLGCHIVGAEAGTLIAEVVIAMEFGASAEDITRTCHAHPTLEEVTKEAALAVLGRAVHM
jgi:dihydrolipoamide dehydrogenase